ncbi:histone H2A-beta, sperm-like [Stegodyphus dumicola]|uniref:histone H2A-beta, sperm-like n=1 Tax=Stegodyphus dumicola TaxID=202533 RepID=UPI0015ACD60C|nr:histone H2A-beta, sperm-like [Stegodyphus dumicola]
MPKRKSSVPSASSQRRYKTEMSNLTMSVPRVKEMLKVGKYVGLMSDESVVFLAAVLKYVVAEILQVSLVTARREGAKRIRHEHINMALKTDLDFGSYFKNAAIPASNFVPWKELPDFKLKRLISVRLSPTA